MDDATHLIAKAVKLAGIIIISCKEHYQLNTVCVSLFLLGKLYINLVSVVNKSKVHTIQTVLVANSCKY